jgi:3-oxoadipate enol-lactonase/4-carboxymuconolactone decarboxylase
MDAALFETRRRTALESGTAGIVDIGMQRFFSQATLARRDPRANTVRNTVLSTNPAGYAGCCAAIRDMDHTAMLREIRVPTLVIVGDNDMSTPWEGHGEVLAREIPDARVVRLPATHLSNMERPQSFNAALLDFLLPPDAIVDPLEAGFEVRRSVLGEAHVDAAVAGTTDFTREFQELITRYAWGTIWRRPGLDHRTRRLLVLIVTAALGRWVEFRLYVRTGLASELEPCDLKEVLLQAAVYAGLPAANTAFQIAKEELEKK